MELTKHYIRTLYNASQSGLYALINEYDKKVYLGYSSDILHALYKHLKEIKDGIHDCKELQRDFRKLSFKIIEKTNDQLMMKIFYRVFERQYRKQGYTLYRKFTPIEYKLDYVVNPGYNYRLEVHLVNKRKDRVVVGIFSSLQEAQDFVYYTYSQIPFYNPIYAINSQSTDYFKQKYQDYKRFNSG